MDFDEINSLKDSKEKTEMLTNWYKEQILVSDWLTLPYKNSIIRYSNRIEFRKEGQLHRLNGPAIEYITTIPHNVKDDEYYIDGKKFDSYEQWLKISKQKLRKLKLKKIMNK